MFWDEVKAVIRGMWRQFYRWLKRVSRPYILRFKASCYRLAVRAYELLKRYMLRPLLRLARRIGRIIYLICYPFIVVIRIIGRILDRIARALYIYYVLNLLFRAFLVFWAILFSLLFLAVNSFHVFLHYYILNIVYMIDYYYTYVVWAFFFL